VFLMSPASHPAAAPTMGRAGVEGFGSPRTEVWPAALQAAIGQLRNCLLEVPTHHYDTRVRWTGSTGLGWEGYDRTHTALAPPAEQELRLTTGEAQGDPRILNPEQLVVMAASSCQMLWFLHLAAKARIDVVAYEDDAGGVMPEDDEPVRITEITLRPRIVIAGDASEQRVRKLVYKAHEHCFIANSLKSEVKLELRVEIRAPAST
jgi:organic hydroperoxide reductase OsmC/OhrA